MDALRQAGYTYRHYLVDPADSGIPNHRKRYYLIAERSNRFLTDMDKVHALAPVFPMRNVASKNKLVITGLKSIAKDVVETNEGEKDCGLIFHELRARVGETLRDALLCSLSTEDKDLFRMHWDACLCSILPGIDPFEFIVLFDRGNEEHRKHEKYVKDCLLRFPEVNPMMELVGRPVGDYVEPMTTDSWLSSATLSKPYAPGLSYVSADSYRSFCFTGHYGQVMHKSSGSLFFTAPEDSLDKTNLSAFTGSIRLFTPREVLNFLGFPPSFTLPSCDEMPVKNQYKAVGNSLNVTVASQLLEILLK